MIATVTTVAAPAASAALSVGDTVHIGAKEGYGGTGLFAIYEQPPTTGAPDFWAYCVEHDVAAKINTTGLVGDVSSFLGTNFFTGTVAQSKVLWVLAHSYPAMSLADFGAAAGAPDISRNDAIEATQYAIWRYTELDFDAPWTFATPDSEKAYWYLVDGANADSGLAPEDLVVTVSITPPAAAAPDSLVGPFVVRTNQPTATVSVTPGLTIADSTGAPIDTAAVVDGQEIYLDLRGITTSGSATVTASATGSSATGKVVSVPTTVGGTPTAGDHAQSIILVTPDTTTTDDDATVSWVADGAPLIGTALSDRLDGDQHIAATGGTVVDTVTYANLAPHTAYTVAGELHDKADGSPTGITGTTTFTTDDTGNGSVQAEFIITDHWAGHTLVAFETVTEGGVEIASHADINDGAQTVVVDARDLPTTQPTSTGTSASAGSAAPSTSSSLQSTDASSVPAAATAPTSPGPSTLANTGVSGPTTHLAVAGLILLLLGSVTIMTSRRSKRTH